MQVFLGYPSILWEKAKLQTSVVILLLMINTLNLNFQSTRIHTWTKIHVKWSGANTGTHADLETKSYTTPLHIGRYQKKRGLLSTALETLPRSPSSSILAVNCTSEGGAFNRITRVWSPYIHYGNPQSRITQNPFVPGKKKKKKKKVIDDVLLNGLIPSLACALSLFHESLIIGCYDRDC